MMVSKSIIIEQFKPNIQIINGIRNLIIDKYEHLFFAVVVHGSVATNEVIPYSDFDGLLIVKDDFVDSKELQQFKHASMKMILEFDPFQHHGWFQIKESDLKQYPQYYLPYEILEYSKLIYPNSESLTLNLKIDTTAIDYKRSLKQLIASIELQSESKVSGMRLYEFKSFLSKIMLLPSMYYAAKNNKGIFKKQSFDVVQQNFSAEAWHCIDTASDIRLNWSYKLSSVQKLIMTIPLRPFRRLTKMYISPKVESQSLNKIDIKFYNSLQVLINTINKDIFAI